MHHFLEEEKEEIEEEEDVAEDDEECPSPHRIRTTDPLDPFQQRLRKSSLCETNSRSET